MTAPKGRKVTPYRKIVVQLNKAAAILRKAEKDAAKLEAHPTTTHIQKMVAAAIVATTVPDTHQWAK